MELDPKRVIPYDKCDFFNWLSTEGFKKYQNIPNFTKLSELDKKVHALIKEIIILKKQNNISKAEQSYEEIVACLKEMSNIIDVVLQHIEENSNDRNNA